MTSCTIVIRDFGAVLSALCLGQNTDKWLFAAHNFDSVL